MRSLAQLCAHVVWPWSLAAKAPCFGEEGDVEVLRRQAGDKDGYQKAKGGRGGGGRVHTECSRAAAVEGGEINDVKRKKGRKRNSQV